MGIASNDAYKGEAVMENGAHVEIFYLDRQGVRDTFGKQAPGRPNRKHIGWYWCRKTDTSARDISGPFSSSRKAIEHAARLNRKRSAS